AAGPETERNRKGTKPISPTETDQRARTPATDAVPAGSVAHTAHAAGAQQITLDVHFISSLPVMQQLACKVWADIRPVQSVWAVRSTKPDHDLVDDAFG